MGPCSGGRRRGLLCGSGCHRRFGLTVSVVVAVAVGRYGLLGMRLMMGGLVERRHPASLLLAKMPRRRNQRGRGRGIHRL